MSKATYEQTLGPLFNDKIDPALKSALSSQNVTNPQDLSTAVSLVTEARNAMAAVNPPAAIADLNQQAVNALTSLANDLASLRDAAEAHDSSAYSAAASSVRNDGLQLESIGSQFTSQGY